MYLHGLIAHSFLLLNSIPLHGCNSLFIHSLIEEHLGCFQVFVIKTRAAINIRMQDISFQING